MFSAWRTAGQGHCGWIGEFKGAAMRLIGLAGKFDRGKRWEIRQEWQNWGFGGMGGRKPLTVNRE